jgi:acetyltransferase
LWDIADIQEAPMTGTAIETRFATDPTATLTTRSGKVVEIRPVHPDDGFLLAQFFEHLSPEDLRFRFLSAMTHPTGEQIAEMVHVDHWRSEHLLGFDAATGDLVASAMMVADKGMQVAEVAISIAAGCKGAGIGWTMLKHCADVARARQIKRLQSIESRANHAAIEVERTLGFEAKPYEGDPGLVLIETRLD